MISGRFLVVDDNRLNRLMLAQHLGQQGHQVTLAEDGWQALSLLRGQPFDLMLLDIMMPVMDGYAVLEELHADPALRNLPVIVISALDEMDSVVRCIGMGAADYLTKPFDPVLLRARIGACLENKRLRDLELEYLVQVGLVVDAAQAVEAADFDPASLDGVAMREDALGRLARVFQRMAQEVYAREQRLRRQLEQLRLDMEEMRHARQQRLACYLPADRQRALAQGLTLPDRATGAALSADISGFTPLAGELARELGRQRGAEELTRTINQVYTVLINEVHRHGGSVIGFAGDAITCWFDDAAGSDAAAKTAVACALAMQTAMTLYDTVTTPAGTAFGLAAKAAVAAGPVRRLLVGDPEMQLLEAIAGQTVDRLAGAEHVADRGEVVVEAAIGEDVSAQLDIAEWRQDDRGRRVAVVSGAAESAGLGTRWPASPPAPSDHQCRAWVLPFVYERSASGNRQFLSELRPISALFVNFSGIDYDAEDDAPAKLDSYVRWVQRVISSDEAILTHVTMGDKGSYLCLAFGAVAGHADDEVRAVRAGLRLLAPPPQVAHIKGIRIGIAAGEALVGTYGGADRITYDIQGERVNLAARLMIAAPEGGILCDEEIFLAAREALSFTELAPIPVKGFADRVPVYRPDGAGPAEAGPVVADLEAGARKAAVDGSVRNRLDHLPPAEQLVLKVASVLGSTFTADLLAAILPAGSEEPGLSDALHSLEEQRLLESVAGTDVETGALGVGAEGTYGFADETVYTAAYSSMLFAQRRHLHRCVADSCEAAWADDLASHREFLAHHWRLAGETAKAIDHLEQAGREARAQGDLAEAERLLRDSLELHAEAAVLSPSYYGADGVGAVEGQDGPDIEGAVSYALGRLERELPPELTYHNLAHTRADVLPAARRLAAVLGVEAEQTSLLEVGAAFHDIGFLHGTQEHERTGAEIAAQVLPGFRFTSEQVAAVQGMILATRLPQSPRSFLEEILADADLDNLGREDALAWSRRLHAELGAHGKGCTAREWYRRQLKFFNDHHYFTSAARESRDEGKRKNMETLAALAETGEEDIAG